MNLTNINNLPEAIVLAVTNDPYEKVGDISVTELIMPPRILQLKKRHDIEITEDVSDRIWMLMGSAVHSVLERANVKNGLQEERLVMDVFGWKLTGAADLYEEPGIISDFKFTSVWSGIGEIKPEWEAQVNIYAYLYRLYGFNVSKVQIVAFYRDWSRNKALAGDNYPPLNVEVLPVPLWNEVETMQYIKLRVLMHQEAEKTPSDKLFHCTPEERWEKPTKYALMKKGRKRAVRLYDTEEEAKAGITEKAHYVECRKGESTRCEGYCPVKDFCNQYKEMGE